MSTIKERQPLRILMIAPQPFFRARGTPFSVLHRIRALCEHGCRIDLVTYPFGEPVELPGLEILRSRRPPGIRDVRIGPSLSKLALDVPLYWMSRRLARTREYDVLHSHEEAAFFSVRLARQAGLPHIYDMHSSLPQQLGNFEKYRWRWLHRGFEALERHVLETCDGVITICQELADIAGAVCPDTPHAMIENTADDRKVFPVEEDNDVRREFGLGNRKLALYTGTFEAYQGLDLLLEAFRQVRAARGDAHLLLVGGTGEQVRRHERRAESLGISEAVTFTGTVHPSRIPGFLDAADLIVSPRSSGTNTPLKIYGYLRSGRPLVATDKLTHTQTLDTTVACLVEPSAEGLAKGMLQVFDDPAYGARIAAAARTLAERDYSDAAYVGKVLDLYDRVLGRRIARRSEGPAGGRLLDTSVNG